MASSPIIRSKLVFALSFDFNLATIGLVTKSNNIPSKANIVDCIAISPIKNESIITTIPLATNQIDTKLTVAISITLKIMTSTSQKIQSI